MYQSGGLHPVLIGNKFNDRYSVIHKLGSGGYATVWLVRDHQENRYAALKILTADSSSYTQELKVYQHLQSKGENEYKKCWAVPLLDSFWVDGPNGSHLCLVFEVMGPSIASLQRDFLKKIRPEIVRKLALQTLLGLKELHERGVVYGDLSPGNILFRLVDINDWTIEKIHETFGKPDPCEVQKAVLSEDAQFTYEGEPLDSPEAPKFAYEPIDFSALSHDLILPEIRYIDFGEAFLVGEPREGFGVNFAYADPQTLWWHECPDKTSDIWALACVWYEMRTAEALFAQFSGPDDVKNGIIDTLGGLPPAWIERIKEEFAEDDQRPESSEEDAEFPCNEIDQNVGTDKQKAHESSFLMKFKALWHWIKSRVSKKSTKDAVEEVEQQNQDEEDVADSQDGPSSLRKSNRLASGANGAICRAKSGGKLSISTETISRLLMNPRSPCLSRKSAT